MEENENCTECGMSCEIGEYHPYAACLMFKACKNGEQVRTNLNAVIECGKTTGGIDDSPNRQ